MIGAFTLSLHVIRANLTYNHAGGGFWRELVKTFRELMYLHIITVRMNILTST